MVRGLKIAMIIWAVIAILVGLAYIIFPRQLGQMGGYEKAPIWVLYILAMIGVSWVSTGVFVIIAAIRDPIKHIMWVQFAIVSAILIVAVMVYSLLQGLISFSQGAGTLIVNAVFAVVFLALYPWAKPKGG